MSGFSLLCGNGLTLDRVQQAAIGLDPSTPLDWPVPSPVSDRLLIEDLSHLHRWLTEVRSTYPDRSDFELIAELVDPSEGATSPFQWQEDGQIDPDEGPTRDQVHQALRHYLAIAYGWFQHRVDQTSMSEWRWHRWVSDHRRQFKAVMSLNYDLVVERLLTRNQIVFFYSYSAEDWNPFRRAPFEAPRFGGSDTNPRRSAGPVPMGKPHGSCNFDAFMMVEYEGFDDNYPLPGVLHGADAPLRIIPSGNLHQARDIADIVVPGEWSSFERGHHTLDWVRIAKDEFVGASREAETLIVAGCSFYPPDRPELTDLFRQLPSFPQVIVADPSPSEDLCAVLREEVGPVECRRNWP